MAGTKKTKKAAGRKAAAAKAKGGQKKRAVKTTARKAGKKAGKKGKPAPRGTASAKVARKKTGKTSRTTVVKKKIVKKKSASAGTVKKGIDKTAGKAPAKKKSAKKKAAPVGTRAAKPVKKIAKSAVKKEAVKKKSARVGTPSPSEAAGTSGAKTAVKKAPVKKATTPATGKSVKKKEVEAGKSPKPLKAAENQAPKKGDAVKKAPTTESRKAHVSKKQTNVPRPAHTAASGERQGESSDGRHEIPRTYNMTYMRAIARDPECIFVYWEIASGRKKELARRLSQNVLQNAKYMLRLLDVTDVHYDGMNAWRCIDTEVGADADSWYLRVPEPGRSYMAEYGMMTPGGDFECVVRSNAVQVPRSGVSGEAEEQWQTVDTQRLIRASGSTFEAGVGSSEQVGGKGPHYLGSGAGNL